MHKHASCNRYYRLIWSHVHACWVAVAEGARGRGKRGARRPAAALAGLLAAGSALAAAPGLAGLAPPPANALPGGAQVVAGQASVTTSGNTMTVLQGSNKAILNWQTFDVGADAAVRFVQPSSSAVALNRVLGADPSRIYGQLSANGHVFLVNQNGVLFGASARVDVGGLIASSLDLADADFLAGRRDFSGQAGAGAVQNKGSIRSADGGYVALLGPAVANQGSIAAPHGSVALGAGERIGVDLRGDGLITLRIERGAIDALAANSGLLQADGGRVELSARAADALARASVNNSGLVQARGLVGDGGSIRLAAGGEVHAGALDVSSSAARGGQVEVAGAFVALDGAIDAGGAAGGSIAVAATTTLSTAASASAVGRATAGGSIDYRSGGMVVDSASAAADASGALAGGSIAVQGDGGVLSSASYTARSAQGSGGRIDVSGADVRLLGAQLDAGGATHGGLVRVGGAFQGGAVRPDAPDLARFVTRWGPLAPIASAGQTFINDSSAIKVDARGAAGQGGTAVVWSNAQTTMLGSVDARGATAGTVEISSKDALRHVGLERIMLGAGGRLLLDPKNITIGTASAAWTYQAVLGKGYSGGKGTNVAGLDQSDSFGFGLALNAAGDHLAVGTPYDDGANGGGIERGAVHLFSFTDTNFSGATLEGTIGSGYTGGKNLNLGLADGAQFGSAVALNADASRLAVGALGEGSGSVRLFSFGGPGFSAPALTHALGSAYGTAHLDNTNQFGSSVALNAAGDRLAVGAMGDSGAAGGCDSCGAVYLFNNAIASPALVKAIGVGYDANLALPTYAQFGTSVAFDASGDRLAVGAYGVNDSRGAVYLFGDAFGATTNVATLGTGFSGGKNLNVALASYDGFGSGVALNSSGTRLAVGANGAGGGIGNVRIIDFADNAFSAPAIGAVLGSGNTEGAAADAGLEAGESFGFALALNGAGDRLVVGSPLSDGELTDNGGYGTVRAFALMPAAATNVGFGSLPSASATVDAGMLASMLGSGTSVTLQANNDITLAAGNPVVVGDASGNGSLTLQAGRSILLNAGITTGNANLTLVANETVANGVVNAYRDSGAAVITSAAGTTINAGSGQVGMTLANGAGKTNSTSGAITIGGTLLAGGVSLKNLGASANSNVVIGAAGAIAGSGNGTIEIVTAGTNSTFLNNAGAAGIDPGAGRYLVYSNNPGATLEGVTGYKKHYGQAYTGTAPAYAGSGNWFLYSTTPTLNVTAAAAGKTYDGTASMPALGFSATGFIDGDNGSILNGALGVTGLGKNAGSYAIHAGTLGTDLGYAISFTGANLSVTPRTLNATVTGVNKTYDGGTSASVGFGDDRIGGDLLALSGNASFADKGAGNGKTVNVGGIALSGVDAANYTLASTSASTSADVYTRVLNASALGLNKTYDGGTSANVILGDDRIAGDVLQLTAASAGFADKNAGNGKAVTVTGIALGGLDAANYTLAANSAATTANINRRSLSAGALGVDKTYDGGTGANVGFSDNRIVGDQLSLAGSAAFADKHAGSGKLVTVSGMALGGADAGNYTLAATSATTSATIFQRTLVASASGVNKTYDGGTAAAVTFSDDRVAGDVLGYHASASFADKNAGAGKAIGVSGITIAGLDAANYALASDTGTAQADIARRTLNVSASAANKIYDGGTLASATLGDDRVAGDQVDIAHSASFADKNAGSGKLVTVTGIVLGGLDADNYTLASSSATTSASIAQRTLNATVTALDKVYDGSTAAQFGLSDDRVGGDVLSVAAAAGGFADRNAGAGKTVSVSGLILSGADAANYLLAASGASTTASITPRSLNVSAAAANKIYDGGTLAAVTLGDDRVAGDVLTTTHGGAAFLDKNAGSGKLVTVAGLSLSGLDAGNYSLAATSTATSAAITPRSLVVNAAGVDKVYDGGVGASVVLGDDRVAGDQLDIAHSAGFADKHAGNGKIVTVTGLALGGLDAANYALAANSVATSANIGRRTLNAAVSAPDKVYDGSVDAAVVLGDDRVAGDLLAVGAAGASFADKNAGTGKKVNVSGLSLSGADASNYLLAASGASTTAAITPRMLNVSAAAANKIYDGGTLAAVTLGDDRVAGDVFTATHGGAAFLDKNAGSGKPVTVAGLSLSGLDAGNYSLAATTTATSAAITPRSLVVNAAGVDKVYDGSVGASVVLDDDRVAGDRLSIGRSASFADPNAGQGKLVSVHDLALGGPDAANYALAAATLSTSATIAPRALVASVDGAVTKTYDGTTRATLAAGQVQLGGFVAGEGAAVGALNAVFDSANVAQAGAVRAALAQERVAATGATQLSNYLLPASVAAAGTITPKALTVSGMRAAPKTYDGNTAATLADLGTIEGLVAGESLQLRAPTEVRFDTRGAGSGKRVTASGYGLGDGSNGLASNYVLAGQASSTDGVINQATLTVKANDATRAAGRTNPVFGFSLSGLVGGDSPAILPEFVTASPADSASAPGRYAITAGSSGTLENYRLAFVDGVLTVTDVPLDLSRAIASTILPVLPQEALRLAGGELADAAAGEPPRALPPAPVPGQGTGPAPVPAPRADGAVITLSGGTEVLTRNGGIRTAE